MREQRAPKIARQVQRTLARAATNSKFAWPARDGLQLVPLRVKTCCEKLLHIPDTEYLEVGQLARFGIRVPWIPNLRADGLSRPA